jgi:hypothetical protein
MSFSVLRAFAVQRRYTTFSVQCCTCSGPIDLSSQSCGPTIFSALCPGRRPRSKQSLSWVVVFYFCNTIMREKALRETRSRQERRPQIDLEFGQSALTIKHGRRYGLLTQSGGADLAPMRTTASPMLAPRCMWSIALAMSARPVKQGCLPRSDAPPLRVVEPSSTMLCNRPDKTSAVRFFKSPHHDRDLWQSHVLC